MISSYHCFPQGSERSASCGFESIRKRGESVNLQVEQAEPESSTDLDKLSQILVLLTSHDDQI